LDITYKAAISRLLQAGHDIFIPLQRPLWDEIVISYKGSLYRTLVRRVVFNDKGGPSFFNRMTINNEKMALDDLCVDMICAIYPERGDVWLIPVDDIIGKEHIRLKHKEEWRLETHTSQVLEEDSRLIIDDSTSEIMQQQALERTLSADAKSELAFFSDIMKEH